MPSFKKTIATAKAKVADAETRAFMALLEAIDAILEGAAPHDVLMLCAHAFAAVVPDCCEAHQCALAADYGWVRAPLGTNSFCPNRPLRIR